MRLFNLLLMEARQSPWTENRLWSIKLWWKMNLRVCLHTHSHNCLCRYFSTHRRFSKCLILIMQSKNRVWTATSSSRKPGDTLFILLLMIVLRLTYFSWRLFLRLKTQSSQTLQEGLRGLHLPGPQKWQPTRGRPVELWFISVRPSVLCQSRFVFIHFPPTAVERTWWTCPPRCFHFYGLL